MSDFVYFLTFFPSQDDFLSKFNFGGQMRKVTLRQDQWWLFHRNPPNGSRDLFGKHLPGPS